MATSLTNTLLSAYFSSQLPDLSWTTDSSSLIVSLYSSDSSVGRFLEVTLTAVSGTVKLWEVRDAVERRMRHLNKPYIPLQVQWKTAAADNWTASSTIHVYYCSQMVKEAAGTWLDTHFLTTLNSKPLPGDGATEYLTFFASATEEVTPMVTVTCGMEDGSVRNIYLEFFEEVEAAPGTAAILSWTVADMLEAAQTENADVVDVRAVSIRAGSRMMNYYRPAVKSNAAFVFLNCFGISETAWLNCATTRKMVDNKKVATVARRSVTYDLDARVTHDVETCPLPLATAYWLGQLICSPATWLGDGTPIVITDGDASISDDAAAVNTVKFTWRRDDGREELTAAAGHNIFIKPPFTDVFI